VTPAPSLLPSGSLGRWLLAIAVSVALVVGLMWSVDTAGMADALAQANSGWLVMATALSLGIHLVVEPLLLWWILRMMGHRVPVLEVVFVLMAVAPIKLLTPAKRRDGLSPSWTVSVGILMRVPSIRIRGFSLSSRG